MFVTRMVFACSSAAYFLAGTATDMNASIITPTTCFSSAGELAGVQQVQALRLRIKKDGVQSSTEGGAPQEMNASSVSYEQFS
jgi:hypothetical protein